MRVRALLPLFALVGLVNVCANSMVTTFAGTFSVGAVTSAGGPLPATLYGPTGLAFDVCTSTLYTTAREDNQVYSIRNGIVARFAGNGTRGVGGFGAAAASSALSAPETVTVGPDGLVYIINVGSSVVNRVDLSGVMTVYAGLPQSGPVYVSSGDGGLASQSYIYRPRHAAFEPITGDLLIGESGFIGPNVNYAPEGCRIRRVSAATGIISTEVGSGICGHAGDGGVPSSALISSIYYVAFDSQGSLFFSEFGQNCSIRKVSSLSGFISTVVGNSTVCTTTGDGGAAFLATVNTPLAIVFDRNDNLFFVDYGSHTVRMVSNATLIVITVAGRANIITFADNLPALQATFNTPRGLIILNSTVLVADQTNNLIRSISNASAGGAAYALNLRCMSVSPSVTPALTRSASVSTSITISPTRSHSRTLSSTPSRTDSVSPSATPSLTSSASVLASITLLSSLSRTQSVSASATVSCSITFTPLATATASMTSSTTRSISPTVSGSLSRSPAPSASVSQSTAPSVSASHSVAPTPSSSASSTVTLTRTPLSPTSMRTGSYTPSTSPTASPSSVPVLGSWVITSVGADGTVTTASGACAPPASDRCVGVVNNSVVCGVGYGGFACASCAAGFYSDATGYCIACPAVVTGTISSSAEATWALVRPALYLLGGLAGFSALNGALVLCATRLYGGTFRGGAKRALNFFIYLLSIFSLISQAAQSSRPGQPAAIAAVYDYMSALRFDLTTPSVGASPGGCLPSQSRFDLDFTFYGTSLIAMTILALLICLPSTACRGKCDWLRLDVEKSSLSVAAAVAAGEERRPRTLTFLSLGAASPNNNKKASVKGLLALAAEPQSPKARRSSLGTTSLAATIRVDGSRRSSISSSSGGGSSNRSSGPGACACCSCSARMLAVVARLCFTVATLLYATTACRAVASVVCTTRVMPVSAYLSMLNADGTTLFEALPRTQLLFGDASSSATALLASSLNGSLAIATTEISVSSLLSDPTVVCREGAHTGDWFLAILSFAFFSLLFPALSSLWVAHRSRAIVLRSAVATDWLRLTGGGARGGLLARAASACLRARSAAFGRCCSCENAEQGDDDKGGASRRPPVSLLLSGPQTSSMGELQGVSTLVRASNSAPSTAAFTLSLGHASPPRSSSARGSFSTINPALSKVGGSSHRRPSALIAAALSPQPQPPPAPAVVNVAAANAIVDTHPLVLQDPGLAFFTASDYRASQAHFRQVDLVAVLIIGVVSALVPVANSLVQVAVKFSIILAVAAAFALAVLLAKPFHRVESWKGHVKVASMAVVALIAGLELSLFLDGGVGAPLSTASTALCWVVIASCGGLLLLLLVSFWWFVLARGAVKEEKGEDPLDPRRALPENLAAFVQQVHADARDALAQASPQAAAPTGQRRSGVAIAIAAPAAEKLPQLGGVTAARRPSLVTFQPMSTRKVPKAF